VVAGHVLLEVLARGGFSDVWKAEHISTQQKRAVKVMHARLVGIKGLAQRMRYEAIIVSRIRHPNHVVIHDADVIDGRAFIAMELLEGRDGKGLEAAEGPLPPERVLWIASEVADALIAAHRLGIIHRDLKPENIFVTFDRRVVVIDFGTAKWRDDIGPRLTEEGKTLGTIPYMSPEHRAGQEVDERTDLYALGMIMIELLLGRHPVAMGPYHWPDRKRVLEYMETFSPEAVRGLLAHLPPYVWAIIEKATQPDREARYPDMEEMRDAIDAAGKRLQDELALSRATQALTGGDSGIIPAVVAPESLRTRSRDDVAVLRERLSRAVVRPLVDIAPIGGSVEPKSLPRQEHARPALAKPEAPDSSDAVPAPARQPVSHQAEADTIFREAVSARHFEAPDAEHSGARQLGRAQGVRPRGADPVQVARWNGSPADRAQEPPTQLPKARATGAPARAQPRRPAPRAAPAMPNEPSVRPLSTKWFLISAAVAFGAVLGIGTALWQKFGFGSNPAPIATASASSAPALPSPQWAPVGPSMTVAPQEPRRAEASPPAADEPSAPAASIVPRPPPRAASSVRSRSAPKVPDALVVPDFIQELEAARRPPSRARPSSRPVATSESDLLFPAPGAVQR